LATQVLVNVIAVWLVLALVVGVYKASKLRGATRAEKAEKVLSWMLLVAVGFQSLYTAFFQIVTPAQVSALVGYANSPFLFEVAVANLGIGIAAILSFKKSLDFKAAVVVIESVFFLGDFVGHIYQLIYYNNYTPANTGVVLWTVFLIPLILLALLVMSRSSRGKTKNIRNKTRDAIRGRT
jgi:hypothetical protein